METCRVWLCVGLVGLVGCAEIPTEEAPVRSTAKRETWEEFRSRAIYLPDLKRFLVDYDVLLGSELELHRYFERENAEGNALVVHQNLGADDRWSATDQTNITYCVSNAWTGGPGVKSAVVSAVEMAGAAWSAGGNVRFVYVPAQDGACNGLNTAVRFNVLQSNALPANVLAASSFPSDSLSFGTGEAHDTPFDNSRQLLIAPTTPFSAIPPFTGILRHELGHMLGFRHENLNFQNNNCAEPNTFRVLTAADSMSVMITPACSPGANNANLGLTLSDLDRAGVAALYGAPLPMGPVDAGAPFDAGSPVPLRLAVTLSSGDVVAKEGAINAPWVWQSYGVSKVLVVDRRIGVLALDGNLYVKDGALNAVWSWQSSGVVDFALASFLSSGGGVVQRIGIVKANGLTYVKEGPLDAQWTWISSIGKKISMDGYRIAIIDNTPNNQVYIKDIALNAPWYLSSIANVDQLVVGDFRVGLITSSRDAYIFNWPGAAAAPSSGGLVSADVYKLDLYGISAAVSQGANRDFYFKQGAWNASWVWRSSGVTALSLGAHYAPSVFSDYAAIVTGVDAYVMGSPASLSSPWQWVSSPAASVVVGRSWN